MTSERANLPSRSAKRSLKSACAFASLGRCGLSKHSISKAFCSSVYRVRTVGALMPQPFPSGSGGGRPTAATLSRTATPSPTLATLSPALTIKAAVGGFPAARTSACDATPRRPARGRGTESLAVTWGPAHRMAEERRWAWQGGGSSVDALIGRTRRRGWACVTGRSC
eukprot:4577538-Prymnesium_polylepis.2